MFDFMRNRRNRRAALQQVATLDRHMRRDIGLIEHDEANPDRDPVLLLSRGPFQRYPR